MPKIVVDPGHGGKDSGATGNGLAEKDISLDIAQRLKDKLMGYAEVTLTREDDTFVSLSERAALANTTGADLFVSIHVNAGGGTGFEGYVYNKASAANQDLALAIYKETAAFYAANGFAGRGLKKANFTVLSKTKMPAILLENLFIDRPEDAAKLKDPAFIRAIAGAIAGGVIKALNLELLPSPPLPHWAAKDYARLVKAGLVKGQHNLDTPVTWGEISAVLALLLDKLEL